MDWAIPLVVVHCIHNSGIPLSLTADEDNVKDGLRFSCLHSRAMELMTAEESLSGWRRGLGRVLVSRWAS